jgi:hypothetical protein
LSFILSAALAPQAWVNEYLFCALHCVLQAAQASAATDDYEAAINRTAQELCAALDSAMESKS